MLHKLSFHTNSIDIGEQILLEYHTPEIGLSNSMAWPIKLRRCVFNKAFLVNH